MEHNRTNDVKLVSEEFSELFHYTNISAFENIYKTRQFWATHYEDLNDSTEFTRFRLKICEFIIPIIRDIFKRKMHDSTEITKAVNDHGGIDVVVDQEVEMLLDQAQSFTFGKHMYKETFVCSFCAHTQSYETNHGLLSQWRGYGEDGGIAIVLDTYKVEEMLRHDHEDVSQLQIMHMGDVVYDHDDVRIKKDFKNVFNLYPEILKLLYLSEEPEKERKARSFFGKMHDHFLLGSTLVKHHAFHEENEVRVVVSPNTLDSFSPYQTDKPKLKKEIRYRIKGISETRYITLFGDSPLPIKRIIVGPSRIQNFNYQRIKDTISRNSSIKVTKSEIPFL